jgi:probable HAF family extracellular repeat protein
VATDDLGTLGGYQSVANGINNSGRVVGRSFTNGFADDHAFLYSGVVMQDLNNLIPSGWTLEDATGINDKGQICGYGINSTGQQDVFLLTPTPEPGTLDLLAAGTAGLLACVWRRRNRPA